MSNFPARLGEFICCPECASGLDVAAAVSVCRCGRRHQVHQGIASLLRNEALVSESAHERSLRDAEALAGVRRTAEEIAASPHEAMEMRTTLEWLALRNDDVVLELGCGDGRYTEIIARPGRRILAVDFSMEALRRLQEVLERKSVAVDVGMVHASIADLAVRPQSFDVVFSTLTSNLPDHAHRQMLYRLAASALKPGGRFVFSAHHYGWRERRAGMDKSGHYTPGGIYRYQMTRKELREELRQTFADVRISPIQIYLPLVSRITGLRVALSRAAERIPLLNNLGALLLCEARNPVVDSKDQQPG